MLTRCGVNLQPVSAFSGPAGEQADGPISGELSHPTKGYVRNLAAGVIVTGVLAVICGIVAVAWPKIPLLALAILIGLTLISLGALSIANAFQHDLDAGARALSGGLGLFGLIGGVVVVRRPWPKESLGTLAVLTGIAFIIRGALMVYRGIQVRRLAVAG